MNNPYNLDAPKKSANLTVNSDLLAQAKRLGVNLSAVLKQSLAQSVNSRSFSYGLIMLLVLTWAAAAKPAARWVELYKDADWNNFPAAEIRVFVGRIQYTQESDEVGFVQRYNPYKLKLEMPESRQGMLPPVMDVYGRAPELKTFRGHKVEIRGKRVQMQVEGQLFDEIWPVSIRALD